MTAGKASRSEPSAQLGAVRLVERAPIAAPSTSTADTGDPLDAVVRPDLRFHYSSDEGAAAWLDLCREPTYGHDRMVAAAVDALPRLIASWARAGEGFAVCSLGPGDGSLDLALLNIFAVTHRIEAFTGIDSSRALLAVAVETLAPLAAANPTMPCALLHADFVTVRREELPLADAGVPRLFLLLGLTLGNYAERHALQAIRGLMRPGDRLAIDARLHACGPDADVPALDDGARGVLLATYDREASRRFAFAPIAAATYATADEYSVLCEVGRRYTDVPGALNIISHVRDLVTRMRTTGEVVRRARLDLGVTTAYDAGALERWIEASGWRVEARETTDGVLRLLLAPTAPSPHTSGQ